jgi:hypothetical protein
MSGSGRGDLNTGSDAEVLNGILTSDERTEGQIRKHWPKRGDQVEAWIKKIRDMYSPQFQPEAHEALNYLLDQYRLHSDLGKSLGEEN